MRQGGGGSEGRRRERTQESVDGLQMGKGGDSVNSLCRELLVVVLEQQPLL